MKERSAKIQTRDTRAFLLFLFSSVVFAGVFYSCQTSKEAKHDIYETALGPSPILSPEESIQRMQIAEGFEVKLVAAEPLITTPVAMTFDAVGRIWAVEMNGYMHDTLGTGEDIPSGRLVILEDANNDGVMDRRKVFLDSLVLPRAICLVEGGVLVAEPPRLWYYEIHNDRPAGRILVDGQYAAGGNVQHQPNGLFRALDNWIYSAKSSKRYRKVNGNWITSQTHFRGQWGISQDDHGRLYYNTNSDNILGDFFLPRFGATNHNQKGVEGFNEKIVADSRVYPVRPTPGVNRGYMDGILDDKQRLKNFTAASGPVIYRGNLFGYEEGINAFLAEPAANLIKRNFLFDSGYLVSGKQAYEGKEFLASDDERFRPVNLFNGPDGALYIVDMYRGILDHITYMTSYLKNQIGQRELTLPLNCGRIYKVIPSGQNVQPITFPADPDGVVKLLGHENGWVRDKAQQILIDSDFKQTIPALKKALKQKANHLLTIHALWTLEGLNALQPEDVVTLLRDPFWPVRMQALGTLPSVLNSESYKSFLPELRQMIAASDTLAAPYIAFIANDLWPWDSAEATSLLLSLAKKYTHNQYVADAIVSSLQDKEAYFLNHITDLKEHRDRGIYKYLNIAIENRKKAQAKRDPSALSKEFPKGSALFVSSCQPCHGKDGEGIKPLAPPLNRSQWVTGNNRKLISIVLFGLTGPINVNDHLYKVPEINGDMPGIAYDPTLSNKDISELLSFIRQSWQNDASEVTAEEIAEVRERFKNRQGAFTVKELDQVH